MAPNYLSENERAFHPLVEAMHRAQERIHELAQGQLDAVFNASTGSATLLGEAQKALMDRQNRFRSLYEVVACGVVVTTPEGVTEYANGAFCTSIRVNASDLRGRRWSDFVGDIRDRDGNLLAPEQLPDRLVLSERDSIRNSILRVSLSHDEDRWFLVHADRSVDQLSNKTTGAVTSWVDVTDMRAVEQQRVQAAVMEERQRLSRDLHDSLSNSLMSVVWQIRALQGSGSRLTADETISEIKNIEARVIEALNEARRSVSNLSMPLAQEASLPEALRTMLQEQLPALGPRLNIFVEGSPRPITSTVATAFLRIAQEASANAVKHANATEISVVIRYFLRTVEMQLSDNGRGFDSDTVSDWNHESGFGLANMHMRARQASGELSIDSGPGGTTVKFVAPA